MKTLLRALAISALLLFGALTVIAYSTYPQAAPPSASIPLDGTPESLAQLFQKECIDQVDLTWVMAETWRRKWWVCLGEGDESDCMNQAAGMLEWDVKGPSNSRVHVGFLNPGLSTYDPAGSHQCSIDASEELGPALQKSVRLLKIRGRPLNGPIAIPPNSDTGIDLVAAGIDLASDWKPAGLGKTAPTVTISHSMPYDRYVQLRPNLDKDTLNSYRHQRVLPWFLGYEPVGL